MTRQWSGAASCDLLFRKVGKEVFLNAVHDPHWAGSALKASGLSDARLQGTLKIAHDANAAEDAPCGLVHASAVTEAGPGRSRPMVMRSVSRSRRAFQAVCPSFSTPECIECRPHLLVGRPVAATSYFPRTSRTSPARSSKSPRRLSLRSLARGITQFWPRRDSCLPRPRCAWPRL